MTTGDLEAAERISADAFYEVDRETFPPSFPPPQRRPAARTQAWIDRTAGFLRTDPDGCWVAEEHGEVLGFATSLCREEVWALATYAVRPGQQGRGIGRPLLDAALGYAEGRPRRMLAASADARAVRRYRLAGFALHPQMLLSGVVDRSAIPAVTGVRDGTEADRELADEIDRTRRGGGHGPDHEALAGMGRMLVAENGRGYAYASESHLPVLAATDEDTARALLWEALGRGGERFDVHHVTAANQWALEVGMRARLALHTSGYLALQGMEPPTTYVHNGAVL